MTVSLSTPETYSGPTQAILADQSQLTQLNEQMATGMSINSPADNPTAVSVSISINQQLSAYSIDGQTSSLAQSQLQDLSSTVGNISNLLQSLRQSALQASNSTMNTQDQQALSYSVTNDLQSLLQLANTQTPDGNYLLGGSQTATQPFSINSSGVVQYNGDGATNQLQIAPGLSVPSSLSGQFLLMNIPQGNGYATAQANSGNLAYSGSASLGNMVTVTPEGVVDPNAASGFTSGTLGFVSSGGQIQWIFSGSGGVLAASGAYNATAGTTITLSGVQFLIQGYPAVSGSPIAYGASSGTVGSGDGFTLAPSTNQSLFQTVQDFALALQNPGTGPGAESVFSQKMSNIIGNLNNGITQMLTAQAYVGSSLAQINSIGQTNTQAQTNDSVTLNNLISANLPAVATQFQQGSTALQAALSAFSAMQGLNLFNTLKF